METWKYVFFEVSIFMFEFYSSVHVWLCDSLCIVFSIVFNNLAFCRLVVFVVFRLGTRHYYLPLGKDMKK